MNRREHPKDKKNTTKETFTATWEFLQNTSDVEKS